MRFCFNDLFLHPSFHANFPLPPEYFYERFGNSYRWHCIIFIGPVSGNFSTILLIFYGRGFNGRKNNVNKLI